MKGSPNHLIESFSPTAVKELRYYQHSLARSIIISKAKGSVALLKALQHEYRNTLNTLCVLFFVMLLPAELIDDPCRSR